MGTAMMPFDNPRSSTKRRVCRSSGLSTARRAARSRQRLWLERLEPRHALAVVGLPEPPASSNAFGTPVALVTAPRQAAAEADFLTAPASGGVAITDYIGPGGDVVIPEIIGGLSVTEIRKEAFRSVANLTSVVVPGTVQSLDRTFFDCPRLTKVVFSEGVRSLGGLTLAWCPSLQEVVFPASLQQIDSWSCFERTRPRSITFTAPSPAFSFVDGVLYQNEITSRGFVLTWGGPEDFITCPTNVTGAVTIPQNVKSIPSNYFSGCSGITSLTISATVTDISPRNETDWFAGCAKLKAINVDPANKAYASVDGVLYDKAITKLIRCPPAKNGALAIPTTVTEFAPVSEFDSTSQSLAGCVNLQSVNVPAHLADLGKMVTSLRACTGLTSITVAAEHATFSSVDGLLYDKAVTKLVFCPPARAGTVQIPASVTNAVDALNAAVSLERVQVASGNPSYAASDGLLYDKAVAQLLFCPRARAGTVTLPATATDVSSGPFFERLAVSAIEVATGNPTYVASDGVLYRRTWQNLLVMVVCPEGRPGAVTLPEALDMFSFDVAQFSRCGRLSHIHVAANNLWLKSVDGIVYSKDMKRVWRVPAGRPGTVALPAGVETIYPNAFEGCFSVTAVSLPSSLQTIEHSAFTGCSALSAIALPAGVSTIGSSAFSHCASLRSITIPGSVKNLGDYAFAFCTSLQSVVVESGVASLSSGTFYDCTALSTAVLPTSLKTISDGAFQGSTALANVTIPVGTTTLGDAAFYGCNALERVVLPASLTAIGKKAFGSCASLRSVEMGSGLRTIGDGAFQFCPQLNSITLPAGIERVGDQAFVSCSRLTSMTLPASVARVGNGAFAGTGIKSLLFLGDAPTLGSEVLTDEDATLVYQRAASGWTNPIAGMRAITTADAPVGLVATVGDRRVKLTWNKPSFDGGEKQLTYQVQVSGDGGTTWTVREQVDPTAAIAVVTRLPNGRQERLRVAIVNRAGIGAFATASVTPGVKPPMSVAFAAPGAVAGTPGDGTATLSWAAPFVTAGRSISGYAVEYSSDGGWTWLTGPRTVGAATNVVVSGLTNGLAYQFRVAAYGAAGVGGFSKPTPAAVVIPGDDGAALRLADDGLTATQFTPDGRLARLTWERSPVAGGGFIERLVYRCEAVEQDMTEEVVLQHAVDDHFPKGSRPPSVARLLFAPDGTPQVLVAGNPIDVYRPDARGWHRVDSVGIPVAGDALEVERLVAAVGPTGAIHFVAGCFKPPAFNYDHGPLWYGTNLGGSWKITKIVDRAAVSDSIPDNTPRLRQLDLTVDRSEKAHVVYSPGFDTTLNGNFTRDYSELAYASNASGAWVSQVVHRPPDGTGASGFGNTIQIAPDGQPAIAQFFIDNVATGSFVTAQLLYHQRKPNGSWTTEVVASRPDGYVAGDGAHFTGFAPQLTFDAAGIPHIAFSDLAAQHFTLPYINQYVFAGQLRHAWKERGVWRVETLVRQANPLLGRLVYPSIAAGPTGMVFSGLRMDAATASSPTTMHQMTIFKTPLAAIESWGAVTLSRSASGVLHANGVAISKNGAPVNYDTSARSGSTAVAADTINGVNTVLWRRASGLLSLWRCDAKWKFVKEEGTIVPKSADFYATEVAFGTDVDQDGWVGVVVPKAPSGPTNVVPTAGSGWVRLSWTAPADTGGATITDYIVQFKTATATTWSTFTDGTSAATSVTMTGLSKGVGYVFRVAAVNRIGQGVFSANSAAVKPT